MFFLTKEEEFIIPIRVPAMLLFFFMVTLNHLMYGTDLLKNWRQNSG